MSVEEAYAAVQQLIAEAVETDPAIMVEERRAMFYGRVRKAVRAFDDLDLDDVTAVYEEDMVASLEDLLGVVSGCLEQVRKGAPRPVLRAIGGA